MGVLWWVPRAQTGEQGHKSQTGGGEYMAQRAGSWQMACTKEYVSVGMHAHKYTQIQEEGKHTPPSTQAVASPHVPDVANAGKDSAPSP